MRKKRAEKRIVTPDPRFNDLVVTKFINGLLYQGRKNAARKVLYGALDIVAEKTGNEPLEVLKKALSNVSPALEVRSRRVGGATYQVPMDVRPERRQTLGTVSYTHLRAHETVLDLVCRLLLEKKKNK